ncbi:MAG: clostripain-related cysteine peptidase, partial [Chloroflexota bacterium]
ITDLSDLLYSTLLSDVSNEMALAIATDGSGSVYLTGVAFAWHFSTTPGAFDTTYNGGSRDVFIAKLNQDGTGLTYSTFLGGSESDNAYAIAVDNTGAVYVTGETTSSNFPTTPGAFQAEMAEHPAGPIDAFAVKLNPLGTELVYSSYLGGSVWERGRNIAVDATGSAVITGSTGSPNFPTVPGGYDARFNFSLHYVFIVKINSTGTSLIFTSFLGITDTNYRQGIALDLSGSVYVTGVTEHSHFPTTPGAFDPIYNGGHDVYIVKLNSSGTDLLFSSFLGGSGDDYGFSIAVDSAGSAYVTGETASSNFPVTVNAFNTSYSGGLCAESPNQYLCPDAFVAKLNSNGDTLMYATFLGGNGDDKGYSIAVDETGAAFITGKTSSPGFPTTSNAYQGSYSGGTCGYEPYTFPCADSFAVKLSPDGTALGYSTFLGKQKQEEGYSIALDATGAAYIVGTTGSFDFPTTPGAFRSNPVFVPNSFIVKLLMGTEDYTPLPTPTPFPTPIPTPTSVPVQNNWTFILYLAGDNNLYPYLNRAIRRLESLPQNPLVNIVVLFDGDRNNDSWRFHVQSDGTYTLGVNKWYMGELNTGNPHVLADFVIWARQNYPADHYYLAIANHGRGTSGVAWDETNSNDNLTTSELRSALNIATNSGIWKVDVLQYDTCLMAMFENAYQVKDYANYMVFSQNLGWSVFAYSDYSQIQDITDANSPYEFATLVNSITSSTTPRQFAMDLAAAYFNHPAIENYPRTISAVDLSEAVSVRTAINTFAVTLGSNLQAIKGYIQNARFAVQKFDSR